MEVVTIGWKNLGGENAAIKRPLDDQPDAIQLLKAVGEGQQRQVKIYELSVFAHGTPFIITTPSKEVYLQLGHYGETGQVALAWLVHCRTVNTSNNRVLINFPYKEGCKGLLCLITRGERTGTGSRTRIDISMAHD